VDVAYRWLEVYAKKIWLCLTGRGGEEEKRDRRGRPAEQIPKEEKESLEMPEWSWELSGCFLVRTGRKGVNCQGGKEEGDGKGF